MTNEQLPENLQPDDYARALLKGLESGAKMDPTLRQQLLDALDTKASEGEEISGDLEAVTSGTTEKLTAVTGRVTLEGLEPRNENEANVLRAVKIDRLLQPTDQLTPTQKQEREWRNKEFNMNTPENRNAMIAILRDYAGTMDLGDVQCFLTTFQRGNRETEDLRIVTSDFAVNTPKGFSEGDLLEIRRTLIKRYLDEMPEEDPYNSPKLWYRYLIRPDVYIYERGEDVNHLVGDAITGVGSQEAARPDRAAYIRGVLEDTLENLDREKDVVAELVQLYKQYPSSDYGFSFECGAKGVGQSVIKEFKGDKRIVKTIYPKKPLTAQSSRVIR